MASCAWRGAVSRNGPCRTASAATTSRHFSIPIRRNRAPSRTNEFKLFQNALDFADLRVRDCMVPRVDVEAVDIDDTSIGQLTARFVDSKYSRIFVWRKSIDNIVGYVNSKSLFTRPANIADVMMQVNFVPETMPLQLMLQNFIKHRSNIAVVIDEFGGTAGVISLEDVLEQIFGEIEDEHDIPDLTEKQVGPGRVCPLLPAGGEIPQ